MDDDREPIVPNPPAESAAPSAPAEVPARAAGSPSAPSGQPDREPTQLIGTPSGAVPTPLDDDAADAAVYAKLKERRAARRRRKLIRRGIALAVLASLVGAGFLAVNALSAPPATQAEPVTDIATRGDFTSQVDAKGTLEPLSSTVVTPEVPGTIAEVRVQAGQQVSKGDVVLVLKNDELDRAVDEADRALRAAKADQAAAYDAYNRVVDAYNAAIAAPVDEAAESVAAVAPEAPDKSPLSAADRAVESAGAVYDQAVATAAKRTVTAPASGSVVAMNAQVGAGVGDAAGTADANRPLIQIADLSQMKVTVQVGEDAIAKIARDQAASVSFPAFEGLELAGTVTGIASIASAGGDPAAAMYGDGSSQVTFAVDVLIPQPDPRLKPGMTAEVSLITQKLADVVTVPVSALSDVANEGDAEIAYVNAEVNAETHEYERHRVHVYARNDDVAVIGRPSDGGPAELDVAPVRDGDVLVIAGGADTGAGSDFSSSSVEGPAAAVEEVEVNGTPTGAVG